MAVDKLIERVNEKQSPCIVGFDPFPELVDNVREFSLTMLDALKDLVPAIKISMPCYLNYGVEGVETLVSLVESAHHENLSVVLDAKANEVTHNAISYAEAYFNRFDADFITVSPYPFFDAVLPFVEIAEKNNKGIFIWIQSTEGDNEVTPRLYTSCLNRISRTSSHYSNLGAVVAATASGHFRVSLPHSYFLVPGYGTQGGTAEDVVKHFRRDGSGALITASRSVIYADENVEKRYLAAREVMKKMLVDVKTAMKEGGKFPKGWS